MKPRPIRDILEDLIESNSHLLGQEAVKIGLKPVPLVWRLCSYNGLLMLLNSKSEDCFLEAIFKFLELGLLAIELSQELRLANFPLLSKLSRCVVGSRSNRVLLTRALLLLLFFVAIE